MGTLGENAKVEGLKNFPSTLVAIRKMLNSFIMVKKSQNILRKVLCWRQNQTGQNKKDCKSNYFVQFARYLVFHLAATYEQ